MKRLFCLFSAMALLSCQSEDPPQGWTPVSPDIATSGQRFLVTRTVRDVQEFSARQGFPWNFSAVEIRVVEHFSYSFSDSEIGGVCYPGRNPFIEIKQSVLRDPEEGWNIIVHELGHCVLGRPHDDTAMSLNGGGFYILRGGSAYKGDGLSVSVMSARGNRMAPKAYYLKELFGLERIHTLSDLHRKYPESVRFFGIAR